MRTIYLVRSFSRIAACATSELANALGRKWLSEGEKGFTVTSITLYE